MTIGSQLEDMAAIAAAAPTARLAVKSLTLAWLGWSP